MVTFSFAPRRFCMRPLFVCSIHETGMLRRRRNSTRREWPVWRVERFGLFLISCPSSVFDTVTGYPGMCRKLQILLLVAEMDSYN